MANTSFRIWVVPCRLLFCQLWGNGCSICMWFLCSMRIFLTISLYFWSPSIEIHRSKPFTFRCMACHMKWKKLFTRKLCFEFLAFKTAVSYGSNQMILSFLNGWTHSTLLKMVQILQFQHLNNQQFINSLSFVWNCWAIILNSLYVSELRSRNMKSNNTEY